MTAERKCGIIIHNSQSVIYLHFGFFIGRNHGLNLDRLGFFITSKTGWDMGKMKDTIQSMPVESQVYGWITSLFGALTLSEWAVIIGIIVTVCGYWRESRYKKRMLELEEIRAGLRDKSGRVIE